MLRRKQLKGARHLNPPKIHLKPFRLQQNLARCGKHVERLIDCRAVDANLDLAALADALDFRPFAERAFEVVFAARVQ